jgi:peroxiredoxin
MLLLPLAAQEEKPVSPVAPPEAAPKVLELGQRPSGDITMTDLDGKSVRAKDLMGKIVVVNFYSIQCPIQRDWDARLAEIQGKHQKEDVVFLHINSNHTEIGKEPEAAKPDSKPYAKVRKHLEDNKFPFRVLLDHGNKIADLFGARTTPHIYVFNRQGQLVYRGLVDDDQKNRNPDSRNNYLNDVLDKLSQNKEFEPFANKEVGCSIKRVNANEGGRGPGPRRGGRGGQ